MSKALFRTLAAVFAAMLLVGSLAACTTGSPIATTAPSQAAASSAAASSAAATSAPAAPTAQPLAPVTLRFYFPGDRPAATDDVWKAVDELVKSTLNAKFDVTFVSWNDFQDKLQLMASSGDNYDMNADGTWLMYPKMVNKGAYLDLSTLAPQYMPTYYKRLNDAGFIKGAMSGKELLCIPWTPVFVNKPFVKWNEVTSGMEAAGITVDPSSIKTIEDLDKAMHDVAAKLPGKHYWETADVNMTTTGWLLYPKYNYDFSFNYHNFTYKLDDPAITLLPLEQTPLFAETIKWNTKWVQDGLMPKDLLQNRDAHFNEDKSMKVFGNETMEYVYYDQNYKKPGYKYAEIYPDGMWTQRSPIDNIMCINKNAANPERTLMFIEMLSSDSGLYDTVMYGVEGKTYVKKDGSYEFPDGITADTSNYMNWSGQWGLWRDYLMKPSGARGADEWQKNAEFAQNPKFIVSPTVSFFPDDAAIKNELAKRDALFEEFGKPLLYGLSKDPDKDLADYIQKQKDAGLDKIMAELQKQIDAYKSGK